ncbi:MAG: stage III sporulation protein AF [Oscillospiraceae bacterium]|nr:stage III sporulation protein AF [Oscillospiraceae bacterium]
MTQFVGEWVRAIAGTALICAAATALTPKGKVKNVLKMLCGIVLIIAMISPILKQDFPSLSMDMSEYRKRADEIIGKSKEKENSLSRTIIEDELETYILDKAKSLNVELKSVEVSVKWGDEGSWYPYEAHLKADIPDREKNLISNSIEAELGVPDERQYWSSYEG